MTVRRAPAAALTLLVAIAAPSPAQEGPLLQAMHEELTRAMTGLRVPGQPAPYYISYTLDDVAARHIAATLGALVNDTRRRSRMLRVDVRVGDYTRDSSRFLSFDYDPGVFSMYGMGVVEASLDDDPAVLRRQLWLVTDAAYRKALNTFARKQAAAQNQVAADPIPDWSRESPRKTILPAIPPAVAADAWVEHVRAISAALASPELTRADVSLHATQGTRIMINSEGFTTVAPIQQAFVRVQVDAQADDGMSLRDAVTAHARTVEALPSSADLTARARELAASLGTLRKAPVGDAYTGPVLVEGQAVSELLAQTFVPLFLSLRAPEAENPQMMGPMTQAATPPLLTRVGSRILPEAFTVKDTPSLARFEGRDLVGAYAVDDEGVPAQDVVLCEKGMLKSLLTSRTPQRGFLTSNGHGRGGIAQAGVFQLESGAAIPAASLKARYLERLKEQGRPFGYILRTLAGDSRGPGADPEDMMSFMPFMRGPGEGPAGPRVVRAYKVTPDGNETLVRGLQLGRISHSTFRELLDASQERTVYDYRPSLPPSMQMMAMMQRGVSASDAVVSLIAPNLVFGELELEPPQQPHQRPPIVPSPLSSK